MSIEIREMTITDYENAIALWKASAGVGLSNADSKEHIAQFLERNPSLSFVAYDGAQLVGTVLSGHDGRRGYIHHLAIRASHRGDGLGRELVAWSLKRLKVIGIDKCHIFVYADNHNAIAFWERVGWTLRTELVIMSKSLDGSRVSDQAKSYK